MNSIEEAINNKVVTDKNFFNLFGDRSGIRNIDSLATETACLSESFFIKICHLKKARSELNQREPKKQNMYKQKGEYVSKRENSKKEKEEV
jgi:hypothetical protein